MTKNKTEKYFSASLKQHKAYWAMKLHNNMLAHQTTPADYIISQYSPQRKQLFLHLVECKEVTCKEGKGRFAFKRLSQLPELIAFENKYPAFHYSWLFLTFYDKNWANSDIYLIQIREYKRIISSFQKVSINRNECAEHFKFSRVKLLPGSIFDLSDLVI